MGRKRKRLYQQAYRLEQALAAHKAPARVEGGTVTPRHVRFQLLPAYGTRVSKITNLAEELALSLGVSSARVSRRGGRLEVEIPREDAAMVTLDRVFEDVTGVPHGTAILGLDDGGAPLLLRIASPEVAHVLICGTTGSGKTVLARTIILSLARYHSVHDLGLILIDPKGRGYSPLAGLPHLARPLAETAAEALDLLKWLVMLMEKRDADGVKSPRLMCCIDELADLMLVAGKDFENLLTRLTQRGRSAGIHIVACTQKPTAAIIGSLVKSNFPVRIVGSVVSPEDAKVATGVKQSGAEKLLGRGDFLLVAKGMSHRFQAAYASRESIERQIEVLRGGRRVATTNGRRAVATSGAYIDAGEPPAAQLRLIK